jgi:CBS domain-containing protein
VSRVVALGKNPATVTLSEVMTRDPECIDAGASVEVCIVTVMAMHHSTLQVNPFRATQDALMKMVSKGYRHLPIQRSDGKVIGLMDVAQLIQVGICAALAKVRLG